MLGSGLVGNRTHSTLERSRLRVQTRVEFHRDTKRETNAQILQLTIPLPQETKTQELVRSNLNGFPLLLIVFLVSSDCVPCNYFGMALVEGVALRWRRHCRHP